MASGDGTVAVYIQLPIELVYLVEVYRSDRRFPAMRAAYVELLETHPRVAEIAERVYTEWKAKSRTDGG